MRRASTGKSAVSIAYDKGTGQVAVDTLALTLHGAGYDANALRQLAVHLEDEIRTVPEVAETFVVGGAPRQFQVTIDPARLVASGLTPGEVAMALKGTSARLTAGEVTAADEVYQIHVGAPVASAADVGSIVVGTRGGAPVYVRNVADVTDAFGEATTYVSHEAKSGASVRHRRRVTRGNACDSIALA